MLSDFWDSRELFTAQDMRSSVLWNTVASFTWGRVLGIFCGKEQGAELSSYFTYRSSLKVLYHVFIVL